MNQKQFFSFAAAAVPKPLLKTRFKQGKPFCGRSIKELIIQAGKRQLYRTRQNYGDEDSDSTPSHSAASRSQKRRTITREVRFEKLELKETKEKRPKSKFLAEKEEHKEVPVILYEEEESEMQPESISECLSSSHSSIMEIKAPVAQERDLHTITFAKDDNNEDDDLFIFADENKSKNLSSEFESSAFITDQNSMMNSSYELKMLAGQIQDSSFAETTDLSAAISKLGHELNISELNSSDVEDELFNEPLTLPFMGIPIGGRFAPDEGDDFEELKHYGNSPFMVDNQPRYFLSMCRICKREPAKSEEPLIECDIKDLPQSQILQRPIFSDDIEDDNVPQRMVEKKVTTSRFLEPVNDEDEKQREERRRKHREQFQSRTMKKQPILFNKDEIIVIKKSQKSQNNGYDPASEKPQFRRKYNNCFFNDDQNEITLRKRGNNNFLF